MPPIRRRTKPAAPLSVVPQEKEPTKASIRRSANTGQKRPPASGETKTIVITGKMADLCNGLLTVEDMDIDELARMQFRNVNGQFNGRPPAHIPRDIVNKMRVEFHKRLFAKFDENLDLATDVLIQIATQGETDAVRLKAVQMLLERRLGKVPDKVELSTGETPFEVKMSNIVRRAREEKK